MKLIGYDPTTGSVEFAFSDHRYLKRVFPNNTAHPRDFWGSEGDALEPLYVPEVPTEDIRGYRVVDGQLALKPLVKLAASLEETNPLVQVEVCDRLPADDNEPVKLLAPGGRKWSVAVDSEGTGSLSVDPEVTELGPDPRLYRGEKLHLPGQTLTHGVQGRAGNLTMASTPSGRLVRVSIG